MLLLGPPGSGKSDLGLRLLSRGFVLVGDDRVVIDRDVARPTASLAGLLEVRGLGIVRLPYAAEARLVLAVELVPEARLIYAGPPASDPLPPGQGVASERLPQPRRHDLGIPVITLDAFAASAPDRVALALDCALGHVPQVAGAFAA